MLYVASYVLRSWSRTARSCSTHFYNVRSWLCPSQLNMLYAACYALLFGLSLRSWICSTQLVTLCTVGYARRSWSHSM